MSKTCDQAACSSPAGTKTPEGWWFCHEHLDLHQTIVRTDRAQKNLRGTAVIALSRLRPHPLNVRKNIGPVDDLVVSMRSLGPLQPLLVTPDSRPDHFLVVAGHRRLAAAQELGLRELPCVARDDVTPSEVLQMMLAENINRQALDPVDEGLAFKALIDQGVSGRKIQQTLGKKHPYVSDRIQILGLPPEEQEQIRSGQLSVKRALRVIRHRRQVGSEPDMTKPELHFDHRHPLAGAAKALCEQHRSPMVRLLGDVACGACWEQVVREDERAAA